MTIDQGPCRRSARNAVLQASAFPHSVAVRAGASENAPNDFKSGTNQVGRDAELQHCSFVFSIRLMGYSQKKNVMPSIPVTPLIPRFGSLIPAQDMWR